MYTNVHTYIHKYISIYSKGMLTHIYIDGESVEERGERWGRSRRIYNKF